jgi:D-threonine aldolase
VQANLRRMIQIAGGIPSLRPHLKTHKMPDLVSLQLVLGIRKFKCATIAEAEMAASCGVPDLLLAYPPIGPNAQRFANLVQAFPQTHFSVIGDEADAILALSKAVRPMKGKGAAARGGVAAVEVLLDIDVGQHRTGVPAGARAVDLYRFIASLPGLIPGGLHAYDGHLGDPDLTARTRACEAAFAPVTALQLELRQAGLPVPRIVAGGTPTFPIHARRGGVECSPGTCVFWDAGYATRLPDLDFLPAALVLTRVVSKPSAHCLCLDLGHKAIASEMPHPRVQFLNLPDAKAIAHSEEHLVIESARASEFRVGDCLYGWPWHICPTVALHAEAVIIERRKATGRWRVLARERRITI